MTGPQERRLRRILLAGKDEDWSSSDKIRFASPSLTPGRPRRGSAPTCGGKPAEAVRRETERGAYRAASIRTAGADGPPELSKAQLGYPSLDVRDVEFVSVQL